MIAGMPIARARMATWDKAEHADRPDRPVVPVVPPPNGPRSFPRPPSTQRSATVRFVGGTRPKMMQHPPTQVADILGAGAEIGSSARSSSRTLANTASRQAAGPAAGLEDAGQGVADQAVAASIMRWTVNNACSVGGNSGDSRSQATRSSSSTVAMAARNAARRRDRTPDDRERRPVRPAGAGWSRCPSPRPARRRCLAGRGCRSPAG